MQKVSRIGICILVACGASGCVRADFTFAKVPGTTVYESEEDFASVIIGGKYKLFNNTWNKHATTGRYRQKIFVKEVGDQSVFGWAWKWKESAAVATYPEVIYGVSPWNGEVGKDSGMPFVAGQKKLVVNYDASLQASGAYNLAFEFWTVSSLPVRKEAITHEVMIWVAAGALGAAGSQVDRAVLDGHAFDIMMAKGHGDVSGQNKNTWTILTLIADTPILKGPLDVGAIIEYLMKQGLLSRDSYVTCLELGTEVKRGSGSVVLRDFSVTVR